MEFWVSYSVRGRPLMRQRRAHEWGTRLVEVGWWGFGCPRKFGAAWHFMSDFQPSGVAGQVTQGVALGWDMAALSALG